jgi:hypothetical protein
VDVAGAVLAGEQAAVAVGKTPDGVPCRTMLVTLVHQGLADAPEQPCPATGLVVDRTAAVHRERSPGRMLDLVEPLPIRDDRSADDQATHREHHRGTTVLPFGQAVDLANHNLQCPVDLGVAIVGHSPILLSRQAVMAQSSSGHGRQL